VIPGVKSPDGSFEGTPFYRGLRGPRVYAKVVRSKRKKANDGKVQADAVLGLWTDERRYSHLRGASGIWEDASNNTRDWLEERVRSKYATWTGNLEIVEGMAHLSSLHDQTLQSNLQSGNFEECDFTAQTAEEGGVPPQRANVTWCLARFGVRRTPDPADPSDVAQTKITNYDEAGIKLACPSDPFNYAALHEARHIWQYVAASCCGAEDGDNDFAFQNPPPSALILTDDRYAYGGRGSNPEFDYYERRIPDVKVWGDYGPAGMAGREADAIRSSAPLAGVTPRCADGYQITMREEQAPGGWKIIAEVKWKKQNGTWQPYEGVTVVFETTGSGNMVLTEDLEDGDMTPPTATWTSPPVAPPGTPLVPDKTLDQILRIGTGFAVSRVRYAPQSRTITDARVKLKPPAGGSATATSIRATLIEPKSECQGATKTATLTVSP
jgi:hypothetical protein